MKITVFCGASLGHEKQYQQVSQQLGQWIVNHHYELVYGGGKLGLMGIIADTVLQQGGTVTGVMPNFLVDRELAHSQLSQLITVDTMSQRKDIMAELGDVFIALPGGPGTLEEIIDMISWARIGKNDKPCILFNQNGYYQPLQKMFDVMVEQGFLSSHDRQNVLFSDDLQEIHYFINHYQKPQNIYS